jgi:inhibitor of KinA
MLSLSRRRNFLAEIGDALRFEAIDRATFDALHARAEAGEIVGKRERLR